LVIPSRPAAVVATRSKPRLSARLAAFALMSSVAGPALAAAAPAELSVDATHIVHAVSPRLYGLMTEEINHSTDGGLYAEMVQNRNFHTSWDGEAPWDLVRRGGAVATRSIDKTSGPSATLSYSVKLDVAEASPGNEAGLTNPGYWGYGLKPGTRYAGSLYARGGAGGTGPLTVRLVNDRTGAVQAQATVTIAGAGWAPYRFTLATGAIQPSTDNHLEVTMARPGTVWLQLVSLMQPTYKDRPNGNRIDLMERMAALHPKFLRLPGGNFLEGMRLADWYDWKKTVGPLVDRPGHEGAWFYRSSDGLGLLEYLEWCEDLGVEPVLAVYAGYSLNGEHVATGKDMEPYVQSALDEIEYVTGDASTRWGAVRARHGHPAPFKLHYVEIGNEDYLDKSGSYTARFDQFAKAIRAKYPQYQLISTDGNAEYATRVASDVSDEHFYLSPSDMMNKAHHYDTASRSGPKIFVGEWATRSGSPTPNFGDALGDAAWMTGMERNSDLIVMAAYAPLFTNVNPGAVIWQTDLIGFDGLRSYGSPSYWAQSLFAGHLGDGVAESRWQGSSQLFFHSATVDTGKKMLHLKLVNAATVAQPLTLHLKGVASAASAHIASLHAATFEATNSIRDPDTILPVATTARVSGPDWAHTVPPLTIEVIDIPLG
jgi:alpha-N-arabinofuranosidase